MKKQMGITLSLSSLVLSSIWLPQSDVVLAQESASLETTSSMLTDETTKIETTEDVTTPESQVSETTTEEVVTNEEAPRMMTIQSTPFSRASSTQSGQTHTVVAGDYLYKIALKYGVTVSQLKEWNKLTSNYIYVGDQLVVSKPGTSQTAPTTPTTTEVTTEKTTQAPKPTTSTGKTYTVVAGDYLYKIATKYGVTVNQLKEWNKLTSNYIYVGDKLIVSKPGTSQPAPTTPTTTEATTEKTTQSPKPTSPSAKTYTVVPGDYLYKIASQHGVTVEQLKQWNKLTSNYIYVGDKLIVSDPKGSQPAPTPVPPIDNGGATINKNVQAVLDQYRNAPIKVFYDSMTAGDNSYASLRGDEAMYGASSSKIFILAFVQDQVSKGKISWNTSFPYSDAIYNHAESYQRGGSGSIQYQANYWNRSYTVQELVHHVTDFSDNMASNMLLHYVGMKNKAEFDRFMQEAAGKSSFSKTATPRQFSNVLNHMWNKQDHGVLNMLDDTGMNGTMMDVLPVNVYQKYGAVWPTAHNITGIARGRRPFNLTIMTNYWTMTEISNLARQIYNAVYK